MKLPAEPKRPCEVLCLFPLEFPTTEGDAYCYLTMDVYSQFLMQTGVDYGNDIVVVLEHIRRLMQHENFVGRKESSFILVLHKYELYRPAIEAIIESHGGSLVIDESYLSDKMLPVIASLFTNMIKDKM